jgi:hypothetical protein
VPRQRSPFESRKVFPHPIQFADMPLDGYPLIIRCRLPFEPGAPDLAEQVGMRTGRDQVRITTSSVACRLLPNPSSPV